MCVQRERESERARESQKYLSHPPSLICRAPIEGAPIEGTVVLFHLVAFHVKNSELTKSYLYARCLVDASANRLWANRWTIR